MHKIGTWRLLERSQSKHKRRQVGFNTCNVLKFLLSASTEGCQPCFSRLESCQQVRAAERPRKVSGSFLLFVLGMSDLQYFFRGYLLLQLLILLLPLLLRLPSLSLLLFTIYYLLFTIYYLLFTTYCLLFAIRSLLFTLYYLLFTIYYYYYYDYYYYYC